MEEKKKKVGAKFIIAVYLERNRGKVIHYHNMEDDLKAIGKEFDVYYNNNTYSRAFRDLKEKSNEVSFGGKKFLLEEVRNEDKNYKGWKILEVTKTDEHGQFILL